MIKSNNNDEVKIREIVNQLVELIVSEICKTSTSNRCENNNTESFRSAIETSDREFKISSSNIDEFTSGYVLTEEQIAGKVED